MPKRSAAAQARLDEKRGHLMAELAKYQALSRDLRNSNESTLNKTHKLKEYHKKIMEIQSQLDRLGK